jgi:G6PDH family F420-dependent oxidoreductase
MPRFGFKLMCELHGPKALVQQAVQAEEHGFDFVAISDHFHPWLPEHGHSPFAWSVLGAVASQTSRVDIATGVTCPIGRYHPAIVAQAAATVASMADGRFTLAVGAGERLNEHVTGARFPAVEERHDMLAEAVQVMRGLWSGAWTTHHGRYFTVEDARIYDLPSHSSQQAHPIDVVVAVSGRASVELAGRVEADGIMAVGPDKSLVEGWARQGGDRAATWAEVPFGWAPSDAEGLRLAHERFRFGVAGWKVMSELPNPVNFAAACATVRPEDVGQMMPYGCNPQRYADAVKAYLDAGFEHLAIIPVGDDIDGFFRFWEQDVRPELA